MNPLDLCLKWGDFNSAGNYAWKAEAPPTWNFEVGELYFTVTVYFKSRAKLYRYFATLLLSVLDVCEEVGGMFQRVEIEWRPLLVFKLGATWKFPPNKGWLQTLDGTFGLLIEGLREPSETSKQI